VKKIKEVERSKINRQVLEYLGNGGTIEKCDHTHNAAHNSPIKRNRKQQIAHQKKYNRIRG